MMASNRSDLPYGIEIPIRYYHNGDSGYATINMAQVLYQYDSDLPNPYNLGEGEVLLVSPEHGLVIGNSIDLEFTN